jgi:TPR repeat protein
MEAGDGRAHQIMGYLYHNGTLVPRSKKKALEVWEKGAELGSTECHASIASALAERFENGQTVDGQKVNRHWELAAVGGHVEARHNLGGFELQRQNFRRGMKHFMISASAGYVDSLEMVKEGLTNGDVTKDEFERTLRAHKDSVDAMKSEQRDMASLGKEFWDGNSHVIVQQQILPKIVSDEILGATITSDAFAKLNIRS